MPEWIKDVKDLSIGVIAVIGMIVIAYQYAVGGKKKEDCKASGICATQMTPYLTESIKINTELVTLLKEQQADFKQTSAKQQEALQGLVIAVNQLVMLTEHTFERVKELDRR